MRLPEDLVLRDLAFEERALKIRVVSCETLDVRMTASATSRDLTLYMSAFWPAVVPGSAMVI